LRGPPSHANRNRTTTSLFDGVASDLLLFLISVGLSVTLGLMNFINLSHGAFAILGGYVCTHLQPDLQPDGSGRGALLLEGHTAHEETVFRLVRSTAQGDLGSFGRRGLLAIHVI
jgi:ABC-type branched-subunit amino acid transport system permease subunit